MNRIVLTWAVLFVAGCATTESPPPADSSAALADSPAVVDGDVTSATVNGIQVLVKRIPGAALAAGQLYIRGGARNWTAETAGIELLALSTAVAGGTHQLDKDAFSRKLATLGTHLYNGTNKDWSVITTKGLQATWDESFALLAGAFLDPALPASEIEIQRAQQITLLREFQESPESRANLELDQRVYAGHPYANEAEGTLENVPKFDAVALSAHMQKLRETRRLLFVAVGDLDAQHVIDQVRAAFGKLPPGDFQFTALPGVSFAAPAMTGEKAEIPTNYILSAFSAPRWADADFVPAMVAMNQLAYRLFVEVRTKRNLSYAPGAHLARYSTVPYGVLSVSAVDPNTTMKVMLDETHRLANEVLPEKDLAGTKSTFLTSYLERSESVVGQAALLASYQIYTGDWHGVRQLPGQVRAVSATDVQTFAKKIGHLQTVIVGDPSKLDPTLFF